jgi:hypothetical protein
MLIFSSRTIFLFRELAPRPLGGRSARFGFFYHDRLPEHVVQLQITCIFEKSFLSRGCSITPRTSTSTFIFPSLPLRLMALVVVGKGFLLTLEVFRLSLLLQVAVAENVTVMHILDRPRF